MKLWQKISLIALVFVTLAVQLTQFYILDSHFRSAIAREVNSAASAHSALAASLSNHAAYERLKANTLFLSTDQLTDMLKDTITTDISTADVIEVKKGGKTITAVGTEVLDGASYDLASVKPNDAITDGKTVIFDAGEKTYLMVVSIIKLEAMSYELRTVYDVTNVYDEHDANLNNARMWGLCCGGGISVLLLISVLGFLRPLRRAVKTIGAAAAGDYTVRMPEKGSSELKTLAHSINEMTASINEREEKLRGIAESRKRFADAMAHEMKTPLTSILGFADILRIKSVVTDEQRRDFASAIVEEAKRLRGLSAKLLTLASTDNTPLDFADIPVAQLFSDVHATMAPVLGRRGIKLTTLHKNAVLHIDRELFLSLLYNLIDNAAKASPDNSEIWLIQSELDGHTVVSVIDRGMGMKPDTVRRATEAFYMEDKARSRKAGGAGLGLALCDDICRRHGARLEIRSTYQKGTTIIIHMNVAPIPKNQGDELEALLQKRPPREKTRDKAREKERQKRKKQRETRHKGGRTI
jgi:signal transduction histidine kinase